jgi:hypothetical protein
MNPNDTMTVGKNLFELTATSFANANQVVDALHNGSYTLKVANLTFGGFPSAFSDVLVAYQDLGGNTHIMDLNILSAVGSSATTQRRRVTWPRYGGVGWCELGNLSIRRSPTS